MDSISIPPISFFSGKEYSLKPCKYRRNRWSRKKATAGRPGLKMQAGHCICPRRIPAWNDFNKHRTPYYGLLPLATRFAQTGRPPTPPARIFALRAPASSNGGEAEWDFEVCTQARGVRCVNFLCTQARGRGHVFFRNVRHLDRSLFPPHGVSQIRDNDLRSGEIFPIFLSMMYLTWLLFSKPRSASPYPRSLLTALSIRSLDSVHQKKEKHFQPLIPYASARDDAHFGLYLEGILSIFAES